MNCKKIFDEGKLPRLEDLNGMFRVCLVGRFLPRLSIMGHKKIFNPGENSSPSGYNRFFGFFKIAFFKVYIGDSLIDPRQRVLKIMYDNPNNAFFIRPLTDEVRETAPGKYIGRGVYSVLGRKFNIFYFTISKKSS